MKKVTLLNLFSTILFRDLLLGMRNQSELVNPLIFFIMVITMFPLTIGPDQNALMQISPAIVWVAAVLASNLTIDGIFRSDYEDGSLEQMILSPHSGFTLVMAKILAHWLLAGVPLIIMVLLTGPFLYLPDYASQTLFYTLLLGTPVLSLIGAIAGGLTMGVRSSGMLQALLILPLIMPLLIFSVSAVNNAMKGLPVTGELYFLAAMLVLALTLAPIAVFSALRIRLGE
ncbi:MAG: heme exporter protein CcmB [Gammaproteobacteria bacterium]|nr:heme exporter protein CcmB [Gammaproteobacteria bacterium]